MRAAFRIALVGLGLSVEAVAYAQENAEPTPAQVRAAAEAFDKGREAYKAEDYVEAAEQFEKADGNAPSLAALELAIRARDKAGELDRAATLMALAQRRHPNEESLGKIAADVSRRAGATLFELTANCDQPCDLTVGGKIVHGRADTQRVLFVQPGSLTVRAGWADDRSDSKVVEAVAGGRGEITFVAPESPAAKNMAQEPTPAPITTAPPPAGRDEGTQSSSGMSPALFYVGAGLTAVLGGVTVWSGLDTLNNPGTDAVKEACASGDKARCDSLYEQGRSHQTRTNVLIGATAAVGVATIAIGIWGTDWSGGKGATAQARLRSRPHVAVTAWGMPAGGGLQAVGRF